MDEFWIRALVEILLRQSWASYYFDDLTGTETAVVLFGSTEFHIERRGEELLGVEARNGYSGATLAKWRTE